MKEVRLGIVGCGIMAEGHAKNFPQIQGLRLAAVADIHEERREAVAKASGDSDVKHFDDAITMLDAGVIDALLICTPHYLHTDYMIAAFERGVHVLTEKPVAVTAKDAERMNKVADEHPELLYGANFLMRLDPRWKAVKRLIEQGEVGELQRANWTITTWFRSDAYYASGGWRATWQGEGGGVLLNQCPHQLDLFTWLVGSPSWVSAQVGLGKYHNIEVEDDVTAMFRYPNGATGTFITSSGEAPGINRLEIVGDKGTIIVEAGQPIVLVRNQISASEFSRTTTERFVPPPADRYVIQPAGEGVALEALHRGAVQNFINAILHGEPLMAKGQEGIAGLELGNAMLMSGVTGKPVEIPIDREAYDKLLQDLISEAAKNGKKKKQPATV